MTNFWKHATTEQKLAQIDGAIELGLTAKQCAMNVGTNGDNVRAFANKHGRKFGFGEQFRRKSRMSGKALSEIAAIGYAKRKSEAFRCDPSNYDAVRLFPRENNENLFDPIAYETEVM